MKQKPIKKKKIEEYYHGCQCKVPVDSATLLCKHGNIIVNDAIVTALKMFQRNNFIKQARQRFDEYFYDSDHTLTKNQVEHIWKALFEPSLTNFAEELIAKIEKLNYATPAGIQAITDCLELIKKELPPK